MESLHAYIDESRRATDGGYLYAMAAVIVPAERSAMLARELRALLPKGARSLHFRVDQASLSRQHLQVLARWHDHHGLRALAASATIARTRHEQRARVRCLSALAAALSNRAVDQLVIESRQEHDNRADDRVLLDCRRDGSLAGSVVWTHRRYTDEALLWPADAVVGVHGLSLAGLVRPGLTDVLPAAFVEDVWRGAL